MGVLNDRNIIPVRGVTTTKTEANMPSPLQIKKLLRQSGPRYLRTPSKGEKEPLSQKIGLAILIATLSFLGATAGTYVTSRYETSRWEHQTDYATRQALLNKRIELLDRTIRISNKRHAAYLLNFDVESTAQLVIHGINQDISKTVDANQDMPKKVAINQDTSKKKDYDESKHQKSFEIMLADRLQLADLGAEFASVITLDGMYFGPKTKEKIRQVAKSDAMVAGHWWDVDDDSVNTLLDAMYKELNP